MTAATARTHMLTPSGADGMTCDALLRMIFMDSDDLFMLPLCSGQGSSGRWTTAGLELIDLTKADSMTFRSALR